MFGQVQIASEAHLFPGHIKPASLFSTPPYARVAGLWDVAIGLRRHIYPTHSISVLKTTLIDRRTKYLRAIQILLGHTWSESAVRHLGTFSYNRHILSDNQALTRREHQSDNPLSQ